MKCCIRSTWKRQERKDVCSRHNSHTGYCLDKCFLCEENGTLFRYSKSLELVCDYTNGVAFRSDCDCIFNPLLPVFHYQEFLGAKTRRYPFQQIGDAGLKARKYLSDMELNKMVWHFEVQQFPLFFCASAIVVKSIFAGIFTFTMHGKASATMLSFPGTCWFSQVNWLMS